MPVFASLLVASGAVRIASLNLCADEYLLLLAKPQQIVSVSRVSQDREDSPLWQQARRYLANDGSIEPVLKTRPTIILTMGGGGRSTALIAHRLGMTVVDLPYPSTIDDVAANMIRVAAITGNDAAYRQWKTRLGRIVTPPVSKVDAAFLGQSGLSVGVNSLPAQWMAMAGYRQVALPGQRLTLERLATNPPPVLLRSTYRRTQQSLGARWLDHPLVRNARSKSVETDGRPWTCGGPLMIGEIERLRRP